MKILQDPKTFGIRFLLVLIILIVSEENIYAAEDRLRFEKGIEGLPSQMEGNMIRDDDGFLWFCFYGGVGRYDGNEVKYYKPGPNSLSGSATMAITKDVNGNLWILTKDNGLNKYNKKTDTFIHYRHDPENPNTISSDFSDSFCSQRLYVDRSGKLLIGTMGGFDIYDPKKETFTHHIHDPDNPNSLSSNNVTAIIEDRDGMIWVGTSGGGLNKYNPNTEKWTRYQNKPEDVHSLISDTVWSLVEGEDGILWVGTWNKGLDRFDKQTEKFVHYQSEPENPAGIAEDNIFHLQKDRFGNIWISHKVSTHVGLEMYDSKSGKFIHYTGDQKNNTSISSNRVSSVYEDPVTGIFWAVNTNSGVIDKHDRNSHKFELYRHEPDNPDSLFSDAVIVMLEDRKGRFWISTMGGIDQLNRSTGKFIHHAYKDIDPSMGPYALAMLEDSEGDFWILNEGGALTKFDIEKMKPLRHYRHDPNDPDSLMLNTAYGDTIIEDRDDPGILWIVLSSGLEKFDKNTEKFTHYIHNPDDLDSITPGTVWSVWDDGKGTLWASTFGGLNKFDKKTERFTRYTHDPKDSDSIGFNKNSCVFEDSFGNFWVAGFSNGMDKFNRKTGKFKHFNRSTGFPAVGINHTIQEDTQGNLWIGTTESGLIKFNIETERVINVYTKRDGLQDNAFWRCFKTKDGEMWFGGGGGLTSFYPEKVTINPYIPPVVLTSFMQGGKDVSLGMAPEKLKEVRLNWTSNFFEFRFATLNYTNPEKNQYAYMLQGRDADWYYSGSNPFGRYTGLQGGSYLLRLKGSNNDGLWNEEGASIRIIVTSPFWKTTWFYLLALCLFFALTGFATIYFSKLRTEIKDRKQAEGDLLESEKKYRDLIDSAPDLRYRTDMEGKITFVSRSVFNLSGYTVEESMGMKMAEEIYVNPEERTVFLQALQKNGHITNFEAQLKRKDGTIWWASTNAHLSKNEDGSIIGVEGVSRDVTERKQIESELEKLSAAIQQSPVSIIITDLEGDIEYVNPKFCQLTGYSSEEVIGKNPRFLQSGVMSKEIYETLWETILAGQEWRGELQNKKKNGEMYWEDAVISGIFDKKGEITHFLAVKEDITKRKLIEAQLQQSQKIESIGNLAGGIAHDFNNLLFPIIGMSEMLLEDLPQDSLEYENAQEIFIAGRRAGDLVQQILAFSRQSEHKMTPVRVQNVLKEVLKLSRSTIPSNIEIHENIQQDCGLIMADPTQVHQIAMNLITNAYHAIEDKNGAINIKLEKMTLQDNELPDTVLQPGQYVRLSVSDSGIGMTQSTIHNIFEPYFTTKEKGKGTGLGLSVVYGIVKEHKGEIKVYSEVGKGTTFCIYLPLMKKTMGAVSVEHSSEAETGAEKILLVDDEVSVAKLEGQMLSRLGYQVTIKTNSRDALNTFRLNPDFFDLMISDMTMPDMTGDQLSKEILSLKPDIPIVICTGFSERINREQAKTIGVKGFLMKPVIKSDMAQMVRKVLDEARNL
ncbi:MAG: PAS domain S-box protein [Desulfobacteraceae bacterium]|nr:PAS domain S-box protein [Desulfobacteraceae bacterium]